MVLGRLSSAKVVKMIDIILHSTALIGIALFTKRPNSDGSLEEMQRLTYGLSPNVRSVRHSGHGRHHFGVGITVMA